MKWKKRWIFNLSVRPATHVCAVARFLWRRMSARCDFEWDVSGVGVLWAFWPLVCLGPRHLTPQSWHRPSSGTVVKWLHFPSQSFSFLLDISCRGGWQQNPGHPQVFFSCNIWTHKMRFLDAILINVFAFDNKFIKSSIIYLEVRRKFHAKHCTKRSLCVFNFKIFDNI